MTINISRNCIGMHNASIEFYCKDSAAVVKENDVGLGRAFSITDCVSN